MGSILPSTAQSFTDPIEIKGKNIPAFYQNGNKFSPRQLAFVTKENPEATLHMKRARSNSVVATFFSFTGGMLIGWPVGTILAGARPNLTIAGIGVVICNFLPFSTAYQKHARNAVEVYNMTIGPVVTNSVSYKLIVNRNGLGVLMNF